MPVIEYDKSELSYCAGGTTTTISGLLLFDRQMICDSFNVFYNSIVRKLIKTIKYLLSIGVLRKSRFFL
jgi:hypothetical protein